MSSGHKDVAPALYLLLWDLRVDFLAVGVRVTVDLMIKTPHPLHTHRRSYLYIYDAIQHLLQWLVVIRM